MSGKLAFLILICLSVSLSSKGEGADTLTSQEKSVLKQGLQSFSSTFYYIADSLSRKGDTSAASEWFLKIDPYFLMWSWENPLKPDTIMAGLRLTSKAKRQYREMYSRVYNSPRTEPYATFERMHKEDQDVRWLLERCDDSLTCSKLAKRMHLTDSIHFAYLYDYVKAKGWPPLSDGSLHALVIAIHDHEHHEFYIPHLKKAISNSQAPMQPLTLILHWQAQKMTRAGYQKMLDTADKVSFDVSSLLNNALPASLPRIVQAVKKHCPVTLFLTLEAYTQTEYEKYVEATHYPYRTNHIIAKLYQELQPQCKKVIPQDLHALHYLPALHSRPKMVLYVIYDKGVLKRFGK